MYSFPKSGTNKSSILLPSEKGAKVSLATNEGFVSDESSSKTRVKSSSNILLDEAKSFDANGFLDANPNRSYSASETNQRNLSVGILPALAEAQLSPAETVSQHKQPVFYEERKLANSNLEFGTSEQNSAQTEAFKVDERISSQRPARNRKPPEKLKDFVLRK